MDFLLDKLQLRDTFPSLDLDLIQLAITPSSDKLSPEVMSRLSAKYKLKSTNANYQALEFYGDSLLDLLVVDKIKHLYGLNASPGFLTSFRSNMVKNETLTFFSRELDICSNIFGIPDNRKLDKHNSCSDSFEAIIGALYLQYGMPGFTRIKNWLFTLPPIQKYFDEEALKQFEDRQAKELLKIEQLRFSPGGSWVDFWNAYQKRYKNQKLIKEHSHDEYYDYYLFNAQKMIKYYLGTFEEEDLSNNLKEMFRKLEIWI